MKIIKKEAKKKTTKALKAPKLNTKLTLAKPKKNTHAYYGCLAEKASRGCLKGKIGKMCQECKEKGTELALSRQQEMKKLVSSYKQLGISLSKLINK